MWETGCGLNSSLDRVPVVRVQPPSPQNTLTLPDAKLEGAGTLSYQLPRAISHQSRLLAIFLALWKQRNQDMDIVIAGSPPLTRKPRSPGKSPLVWSQGHSPTGHTWADQEGYSLHKRNWCCPGRIWDLLTVQRSQTSREK